jgi:GNAT superfamily N-acetyltransferase
VERHLVQLNIARLRHPIDDPRIADFVEALPSVNGAGEQSSGYVWRLQSDSGDATDIQAFDDPLLIVNLTVWQSLEALKAFAYRGVHRDFFRRRDEWFVAGSSRTALWWLPGAELPTVDDARRRLDFIDAFGTSSYAFEMGQQQRPLVIERAAADDERARQMIGQLDEDVVVVAELDDEPVACGAYRLVDDTTAEIRRMHVTQAARGLRIGASIVADLEAAARSNRIERLVLETRPGRPDALSMYEKFGFRRCHADGAPAGPETSITMEKALTAEPGRLA